MVDMRDLVMENDIHHPVVNMAQTMTGAGEVGWHQRRGIGVHDDFP